jgi:isopenicillin N synthase-like dioxygenase
MSQHTLPKISYQALIDQDFEQVGKAFEEYGFFILSDHPLSKSLQDEAYKVWKAFFELPDEVKSKYERPDLFHQRGYTSKRKEQAVGSTKPDLKEFYHVGQPNISNGLYPENIWPDEVRDVDIVSVKLFETLEKIGLKILSNVALYLGLESNYFEEKAQNGNSILRPIHYFPIKNKEDLSAERAAAHGDINLITLLIGASAEGLEVKHYDGTWIPANPEPNELVINSGDMLERLTNTKLKSAIHRVVNPSQEKLQTSRFSMPFFMHPKAQMDLSVLKSCVNEYNPKKFDDCTAGEFLTERLKAIGLI